MTTQSGINNSDWVYTKLTVYTKNKHDKEHMHELCMFTEDVYDLDCKKPLTLNSVYEIPECLIKSFHKTDLKTYEENETQCGYKSMYEFTLMEWGVLWDVVNPVIDHKDENRVVFQFQTRSNPPIQWLLNVSMIYSNLYFEISSENEMELWDSFDSLFSNGKQVFNYTHKNTK